MSNQIFKLGDVVATSNGMRGPIQDMRIHTNRDGQKTGVIEYMVDDGTLPGSPQVWFLAGELTLNPDGGSDNKLALASWIAEQLGWRELEKRDEWFEDASSTWQTWVLHGIRPGGGSDEGVVPDYTRDLDAALLLFPNGIVLWRDGDMWCATGHRESWIQVDNIGRHADAAMAVCLAWAKGEMAKDRVAHG